MLVARRQYRVAEGELIAVPEPADRGACLLAMRLPDQRLAITVLNFGRRSITEDIELGRLPGVAPDRVRGRRAIEILTGRDVGPISESGRLTVRLDPLSGTTVVIGDTAR
jgi:hypothetical protein